MSKVKCRRNDESRKPNDEAMTKLKGRGLRRRAALVCVKGRHSRSICHPERSEGSRPSVRRDGPSLGLRMTDALAVNGFPCPTAFSPLLSAPSVVEADSPSAQLGRQAAAAEVNCTASKPTARAPATCSGRSSTKKISSGAAAGQFGRGVKDGRLRLHRPDADSSARGRRNPRPRSDSGAGNIPSAFHRCWRGCPSHSRPDASCATSGSMGRFSVEDFGGGRGQGVEVGPAARRRTEGLVELPRREPAGFVLPHQPAAEKGRPRLCTAIPAAAPIWRSIRSTLKSTSTLPRSK